MMKMTSTSIILKIRRDGFSLLCLTWRLYLRNSASQIIKCRRQNKNIKLSIITIKIFIKYTGNIEREHPTIPHNYSNPICTILHFQLGISSSIFTLNSTFDFLVPYLLHAILITPSDRISSKY